MRTSPPTPSATGSSRRARSRRANWCPPARSATPRRRATTNVVVRSAVDVPGSVGAGLDRRGLGRAAARARQLRHAPHPGRRRHRGLGHARRLDDRRRLGDARARHPARGGRRHAGRDGRRVGALGRAHRRVRPREGRRRGRRPRARPRCGGAGARGARGASRSVAASALALARGGRGARRARRSGCGRRSPTPMRSCWRSTRTTLTRRVVARATGAASGSCRSCDGRRPTSGSPARSGSSSRCRWTSRPGASPSARCAPPVRRRRGRCRPSRAAARIIAVWGPAGAPGRSTRRDRARGRARARRPARRSGRRRHPRALDRPRAGAGRRGPGIRGGVPAGRARRARRPRAHADQRPARRLDGRRRADGPQPAVAVAGAERVPRHRGSRARAASGPTTPWSTSRRRSSATRRS